MAEAVLSSRRDVGGDLFLVRLDVGPDHAAAYVAPGQYVAVKAGAESGFYVLASEPGVAPFELLVRNAGSASTLFVDREVGGVVDVSLPLGRGFPRATTAGRPLVVAVVASALGVARAVAQARIAEGASQVTEVYVGVRAAVDVPFRANVEAWLDAGIRVVLCLSRTELEQHREILPRADRAPGYVQAVLGRALDEGRIASGTVVAAAGPEGMLTDLRASASAYGAASVELLTNIA